MGSSIRRIRISMRGCLSTAFRAIEIVGVCLAAIGVGILIFIDFIFGN
jgi:hypothetical protein